MSKLVVQLVTWNGAKYVPYLFDSLRKQEFTNWRLVVLDNGSSDDTAASIKAEIADFPVEVRLIENRENLGFAGGHNLLYQRSVSGDQQSEYFLLLNQDMYLLKNCFERMVKFMDIRKDVAAVSPRLMRWDFGVLGDNPPQPPLQGGADFSLLQCSFTNKIDSLGLKVFRNRRVIEKYTGKEWEKIKPKVMTSYRTQGDAMEVFGVSGAFPMLRRQAAEAVQFSDGTFLDQSYGSYKEDVDLAFRLRQAGYKACVLLDTVAYHDRSAEGLENTGDFFASKNKKKQSNWVKYHSYKNQLMTIYKNEYWQNWLLDFLWIKWYELKKFGWFLLFDRSVLKGLKEVWKNRKDLRNKRYEIRGRRKISWREIRKWWKH